MRWSVSVSVLLAVAVMETGLVPDRARVLRNFLSRGELRWVGSDRPSKLHRLVETALRHVEGLL